MMASYQLRERVNTQVILWAVGSAVYWSVVGVVAAVRWMLTMVVAGLLALAPHAATLAKALTLTAGLVAVVAAVAMIPVTFWAGLAIIGVFGWVTYPRGK